jgi:hypothetical protein
MDTIDPYQLDRCDALFVTPRGEDVLLACPARIEREAEKGRTALVLALFEPAGSKGEAARCAETLGARYLAAGLPPASERRASSAPGLPPDRTAEDDFVALHATRLLTLAAPRTQAVSLFAPLGLTGSADGLVAYEASVRAFAGEPGRNLFLYEERPEAFVPGAVRTRLALLGARLPPAAQRAPEAAGVVRHLWKANEPLRLRGGKVSLSARLRRLAAARRRLKQASPWNPLKAFGPRLQPAVHVGDEDALQRAATVVLSLLPRDAKGRARAAELFLQRATLAAKKLGGVYHAERFWLFLPSGDGLPEVQEPEMAEAEG